MAKNINYEALTSAEFGNSDDKATLQQITPPSTQGEIFNFVKKEKPPKIEKKQFNLWLPKSKYEQIKEIAGKDNMTEFILKAIDYALSNMN